jgi:hypothetical protein
VLVVALPWALDVASSVSVPPEPESRPQILRTAENRSPRSAALCVMTLQAGESLVSEPGLQASSPAAQSRDLHIQVRLWGGCLPDRRVRR